MAERKMTRKAVWKPYDMDTALGTNNSGVLMFNPFLEDTDLVSSVITGEGGGSNAPVFNAQDSVLWNNLRDAFRGEITAMYRELRANGTWSYQKFVSLFEEHQSAWPEAIFNEDAYVKCLVPLINPVTIDEDTGKLIRTNRYLTMLQGSKAEQRKWFLYNRVPYTDSKHNCGDATANVINMRFFNSGILKLKAAIPLYLGVSFGGGTTPILKRTEANTFAEFEYTSPSGVTEMETWVYMAHMITDMGDLSVFYPNECDFSKAIRLRHLKIGSAEPGYSNANMVTLDVRNCSLLEDIDLRNCPRLAITVNLENSPRLVEGYFDGTSITGVELADGCVIRKLHLPSTVTTLTLLNLNKLSEFVIPSYSNISRVMMANIDSSIVNPMTVLQNIKANSQVNIQGIALTMTSADEIETFLDLLDTMVGVTRDKNSSTGEWIYHDEEKAVVSGTLHMAGSLTGEQIESYNSRYPFIRVSADHTSCTVEYYNMDGTQLLYTETVLDGGDGGSYTGTPTQPSTEQYIYTFIGWSKSKNSTKVDADALKAITKNRKVYAAYSTMIQKYTVKWADEDGTVKETKTDQPYGTMPTYTGPTLTKDGQPSTGWTPPVGPVTGDITYKATYVPMYTATFVLASEDGGTTLQSSPKFQEGSTPTYNGATPTTTRGTAEEFSFIGWEPTPGPIYANTTYTAKFQDNRNVVIRFLARTLTEYEG